MSGRMLYQRSGMSFSSRRIFLVTAPSLLNPFGRCPARSVPLPSPSGPPPLVPPAGRPVADQVQPRARAVGAARGRLAASAQKLHRPHVGDVLVGGGVQRPSEVDTMLRSQ